MILFLLKSVFFTRSLFDLFTLSVQKFSVTRFRLLIF